MLFGLTGCDKPGKGVWGGGGAAKLPGEPALQDGPSVSQKQRPPLGALEQGNGLHHFWGEVGAGKMAALI